MYQVVFEGRFGLLQRKSQTNIEATQNYKIHIERTCNYKKEDGLNFTNVDFPTPVDQIPLIKRQNDLAINVFGNTQKEGIFSLYVAKNNLQVEPINLLLSSDKNKSHYCWIKDFRECFMTRRDTMVKNISVIVVYLIFTR